MILKTGEKEYYYFYRTSKTSIVYGIESRCFARVEGWVDFMGIWVAIVKSQPYTIGFLLNSILDNPTTTTLMDMELQFPDRSYTIKDKILIPKVTSFEYPFRTRSKPSFIGWRPPATITSFIWETRPIDIWVKSTWFDRFHYILSYIPKNSLRQLSVIGLLMYTGEVRRYIFFHADTHEWHSGKMTDTGPIDEPFKNIYDVIPTWIAAMNEHNITFITSTVKQIRFKKSWQDWLKDYNSLFFFQIRTP